MYFVKLPILKVIRPKSRNFTHVFMVGGKLVRPPPPSPPPPPTIQASFCTLEMLRPCQAISSFFFSTNNSQTYQLSFFRPSFSAVSAESLIGSCENLKQP